MLLFMCWYISLSALENLVIDYTGGTKGNSDCSTDVMILMMEECWHATIRYRNGANIE